MSCHTAETTSVDHPPDISQSGRMYNHHEKVIAVGYPQPWPIVTSWTLPFSDAFFLPGLASSHAHDVNYQLKFILVNENYSGLSSIIDEPECIDILDVMSGEKTLISTYPVLYVCRTQAYPGRSKQSHFSMDLALNKYLNPHAKFLCPSPAR